MFGTLFAMAAATVFNLSAEWVQIVPDDQNCSIQTQLAWCGAPASTTDKPLTLRVVKQTENRIFALMREPKRTVAWQSFSQNVEHNKTFEGDCDNFVFTTLDILKRNGYDISTAHRVLISLKNNGTPDHMVAVVLISGEWFVIADGMAKEPYRLADAKWKPLYVSEPTSTKWLKVN